MHRRNDAEQTAYYRQQASSCATAALTTAIDEVKQAYLDLEQGWLCLAPKVETSRDDLVNAAAGRDSESASGQARSAVEEQQRASG
jgi:hypothetical protein